MCPTDLRELPHRITVITESLLKRREQAGHVDLAQRGGMAGKALAAALYVVSGQQIAERPIECGPVAFWRHDR